MKTKTILFAVLPVILTVVIEYFITSFRMNSSPTISYIFGRTTAVILCTALVAYGIFKLKKGTSRNSYWQLFFYSWFAVFAMTWLGGVAKALFLSWKNHG